MVSSLLTRASAAVLALVGVALLFAPDVILPGLVPGFPASGAWLGQLLAAGCLAMASLNWISRGSLLGGIYARAVVAPNTVFYFIGAIVSIKGITSGNAPAQLWIVAAPFALLSGVYGWLLFRGPIAWDLEILRKSQQGS